MGKYLGIGFVTDVCVAKENAIKNGVECTFELGTADKVRDKFDFIVANILHFVLAEIMGDLKALMKTGAIMSLSGILYEKRDCVDYGTGSDPAYSQRVCGNACAHDVRRHF